MAKILSRIVSIVAAGILISCSDPPPTIATAKGKYVGHYGGGEEVIVLGENGVFTQRFSIAGKPPLENSGTWTVDRGAIKFEGFVSVFNPETKRLLQPEIYYSNYHGSWFANPDQLIFEFDSGYVAMKQK